MANKNFDPKEGLEQEGQQEQANEQAAEQATEEKAEGVGALVD